MGTRRRGLSDLHMTAIPSDPASTENMPSENVPVVVIGGGPAGATAATLIAQQGYRVAALRARAVSPLPHRRIADSRDLLGAPAARHARQDARQPLRQEVQRAVRQRQRQGCRQPFYFWDNNPHECSQTWQVLRSEFDQMMLDNAREHGVDVHEGVRVLEVLFEGERAVGVRSQARRTARARSPRQGRGRRQRPESR